MEAWKGVFRVDPGKKAESPCLATPFPADVTRKLGHLRHQHGDRTVSSVGNRCLDTSVWLDFSQQEFSGSSLLCWCKSHHWAAWTDYSSVAVRGTSSGDQHLCQSNEI